MIKYSAIPEANDPGSPWESLKLSMLIILSLFGIIGLGALLTVFTGHRDTIMPLVSGSLIVAFVAVIVGAFIRGFKRFDKQKQWMRKFATDNGWLYDETKRCVDDLAAFPPLYETLAKDWNNVRCTVSGDLNGMHFELAHITYLQSAGLIGTLLPSASSAKFAWTSVLRLEGNVELQKSPKFLYEKDRTYTYVICGMNALYRHDIQAMFESVS